MRSDVKWVFCALVVLTGASQTKGQSSASPPVYTSTVLLRHVDTSATPDLTEDPGHDVPQLTLYPEGKNQTSSETTTKPYGTVQSETVTNTGFKINVSTLMVAHTDTTSPSESLSSTSASQSTSPLQDIFTTEGRPLLTTEPLTTLSYQPTQTVQDATSTTQYPQTESPTSATTQTTWNSGRGPVGPTHQELPPELNVGDEEPHYRSSSPLDPLLAGLLSVFIVTTAIVFVVLFLKFRQQTGHPEFHRLQDLPMDDLMEDTPLSRYAY